MTLVDKKKRTGIAAAVGVAFHQGFEGLIFVLLSIFFTKVIFQSPSFTIAALIIKEFITLAFTIIIVRPKKAYELFKNIFKFKKHKIYFLAGIFGTTTGNLFYLLAFQMAGAEYGGILSSLYPVFSLLLIKFINKEKESGKVWMGVIIAVLGAIAFTVVPSIGSSSDDFSLTKVIGIIFGALAAFFWAVEGIMLYFASKIKHKDEKTEDAVLIRSYGTTFTSTLVLLPAFIIVSTFTNMVNPSETLGKIFSSWQAMLILIGISLNLVILRYMHVISIKNIGPKLAAVIDTNNFLVPPLFSIFLAFLSVNALGSTEHIYNPIHWWAWLLIIPIFIGVFIVLYYHKDPEKNSIRSLDHVGD